MQFHITVKISQIMRQTYHLDCRLISMLYKTTMKNCYLFRKMRETEKNEFVIVTEWLTAEVFDFSSYAFILQCHLTMHILSKLKSKFTNITHISSSNRILCLTPKRFVKRNWKGNAVQCCNPVCGRVLESNLVIFFEKGKRNVRNAEDVSKMNLKNVH